MTSESSKVLSMIERFKDDYRLDEKINAVLGGKDAAYLARLLWDNFRDYNIELGEHREIWRKLHQDKDAYSGEDFVKLIKNINKHFPDAMYQSKYGSHYCIHSEEDPPGYFSGLRELLEVKAEDKEFAEVMQEEWLDLPNPYRIGVGYALAQFKIISHTTIPEEITEQIALIHLKKSSGDDKYWSRPHGYPPEVWGPTLVKTACKYEDLTFEQATVIKDMIPYAKDTEQILQIMSKCSNYFYYSSRVASAADLLEQDAIPAFEALLQKTQVEPLPENTSQRWPYFVYFAVYLSLCQRFSHTPPSSLDPFFQGLIEHFKPGWSGSSLQEFVLSIQNMLQQIPQPRLEKMLLKPKTPKWFLLPACPTPKVLQYITDQIQKFPSQPDYETAELIRNLTHQPYNNDFTGGLFGEIGSALIPYFTQALKDTTCPQRKIYADVLAYTQSPDAIEGLILALQDNTKGLQQVAQQALANFDVDFILSHIIPLLDAKRKETRIAVATLLADLPPHKTVYELAQAHIAKESTQEVIALLNSIEPPREDNFDKSQEDAIKDLLENKGSTWQIHLTHGVVLIPMYWRFLEKHFFEKHLSLYGTPYEGWYALLKHFKETPEAIQHATMCIPAFSRWDGRNFLTDMTDIFPNLLEKIKERIQQGFFQRPKNMGKCDAGFDAESTLEWFIENQPQQMLDVLLERLGDKRKSTRRQAANILGTLGNSIFDLLQPLLDDKKIDVRCEAIELIAAMGTRDALKSLQKALENEKATRVQELLQSAIAKLEAENMDATNYPETSEGNHHLEQALERLMAPPLPSALQGVSLPALRWKTGETLAEKAQAWIVAELTQENLEHRSALLRSIRPRLEDESCYALSTAMIAKGPRTDDGWPLYTQSVIGSPEQIDAIAACLEKLASSRSTNWGDDGVEALARYASNAAIRYLDHAHRKGKRDALKWRAARGLRQIAEERGMNIEELVESAVSTMGFDMEGKLCLSYGPRAFFAQLQPDLSVTLTDDKNKVIKSLPAVRKDDEEEVANKTRKSFTALKKQLTQIYKAQKLRLEASLRCDRRWGLSDWQAQFLQHPLFHRLGKGLVWEAIDNEEKHLENFLINEDRTLCSLSKKSYKLPKTGKVRLLHPITLSEKDRERWIELLEELGIEQLFPQLKRQVFTPQDIPSEDKAWLAQLPAVGSLSFINALSKMGYERGSREGGGLIYSSTGKLGPYVITLTHGGWYPELMDDDGDVDMQYLHVADSEGTKVDWRAFPPILFSELVRDLTLLTAAGTK